MSHLGELFVSMLVMGRDNNRLNCPDLESLTQHAALVNNVPFYSHYSPGGMIILILLLSQSS